MEVIQVRLPDGLVKQIDSLVEQGLYSNKSEVVRDAVRSLLIKKMIGIIPNTGDSVKEIREIRKKLSKEMKTLEDFHKVNNLADEIK